jgi:hypothetical protein
MSEPRKFGDRCLMEQIEYLFDTSSDKKLLLQDCLKAVSTKKKIIESKINAYKKELLNNSHWTTDWNEFEKDYDDNFPDSDNHGDTAYVSGMMSSIRELQEIANLLEEKKQK